MDAIWLHSSHHETYLKSISILIDFDLTIELNVRKWSFRCFWFEINNNLFGGYQYVSDVYIVMIIFRAIHLQCVEVVWFNKHNKNQIVFSHYSFWRIRRTPPLTIEPYCVCIFYQAMCNQSYACWWPSTVGARTSAGRAITTLGSRIYTGSDL